jgi:hypothetical protein
LPGAHVRRFEEAGHYLFEDAREEALSELESFASTLP